MDYFFETFRSYQIRRKSNQTRLFPLHLDQEQEKNAGISTRSQIKQTRNTPNRNKLRLKIKPYVIRNYVDYHERLRILRI